MRTVLEFDGNGFCDVVYVEDKEAGFPEDFLLFLIRQDEAREYMRNEICREMMKRMAWE